MAENSDPPEAGSKGDRPADAGRKEREARLAEALRTNLRRRKAVGRSASKRAESSASD
jgi:hypothetical protein